MKFFRFALLGLVFVTWFFGSCSDTDTELEKPPPVEKEAEDDVVGEGNNNDDIEGNSENEEPSDEEDADDNEDDTVISPPEEEPPVDDTKKEPDTILIINELCIKYSSPNKAEFIEFKIFSACNLGGIRVFSASKKNIMIYEFAPVDVAAGDYVVLHLRTLEDECRNEYGSDLDKSGGEDSSPSRDFWVPGSSLLIKKTDAVYVVDQDNNVLDAVMMAEKPSELWADDYMAEAAMFLHSMGAWKSANGTIPTPFDAVDTTNATNTQTVCRDENVENTFSAGDWYITKRNGATPGIPNNPIRY